MCSLANPYAAPRLGVSGKLARMRNKSANHLVVVVVTPGVPVFELGAACEVFGTDRSDLTPDWYAFELVGTEARTTLAHGLTVPGGRGLGALAEADTIVVPACASIHDQPPAELPEAIAAAHRRGARVASICSGAFVLAAGGLLDGREAATHWMHAEELARRYPGVRVNSSALYLNDDRVWTSAGSAAGLDLCLELVRQDFGTAITNEVARRVVTPPHRAGDQAQYIRHPVTTGPGSDARLQQWARENLPDVTVSSLAARARVSERTLNRTFRRTTQMTPQAWLQRERLTAAQELLETSDIPLATIARRVGLGTTANLRARFTTTFGVPPHTYRRTFGAPRDGKHGVGEGTDAPIPCQAALSQAR